MSAGWNSLLAFTSLLLTWLIFVDASLKACVQPVRLRLWDPPCDEAEVPNTIPYQKTFFETETKSSMRNYDTCENTVLISETSMKGDVASLVADAIFADMEVFDVVLLNNGMVAPRDIPSGVFRPEDTLNFLPHNNELVSVRLKGKDLLYALEQGIHRALKGNHGAVPKTAGIRYTLDYSLPRGQRIFDVEVLGHFCRWQPLRPDKFYTILTNSYLANGGDGYTMLTTSSTFTRLNVSEADSFWFHTQATCNLEYPWKRQMDADADAMYGENGDGSTATSTKMVYKLSIPLKELAAMNSTKISSTST